MSTRRSATAGLLLAAIGASALAVEATLIGRVFAAGSYTTESGETAEIGYGHFGIFGLFVIQQVVAVKK